MRLLLRIDLWNTLVDRNSCNWYYSASFTFIRRLQRWSWLLMFLIGELFLSFIVILTSHIRLSMWDRLLILCHWPFLFITGIPSFHCYSLYAKRRRQDFVHRFRFIFWSWIKVQLWVLTRAAFLIRIILRDWTYFIFSLSRQWHCLLDFFFILLFHSFDSFWCRHLLFLEIHLWW